MSTIQSLLEMALRRPWTIAIIVLIACLIILLAAIPESAASRERRIASSLDRGEVVAIAEAEDGATLWAVRREGKTIYFSKGSVAIPEDNSSLAF